MWKDSRGQALIEFALVAPLLFLMVFGIVELGWMFYVNLTMQHAVREGTRYAVTGRSDLGGNRRDALIEKIKEQSLGLYEKNLHDPKEPAIVAFAAAGAGFENYTTTGDPGEANQIIVVSLTYTCPLLTPFFKPFLNGGAYTFTVKSTMTNEPFD